MRPETKFKLKTYIYYLVMEPWTENVSLPNMRTIIWVLITIALIFRWRILFFILIPIGVILYLMNEYKSGRFIYWYRQRKYGEQRKALKEVRENKKNET